MSVKYVMVSVFSDIFHRAIILIHLLSRFHVADEAEAPAQNMPAVLFITWGNSDRVHMSNEELV